MAYFAKLDDNNVVLEVHVVANAALNGKKEEESGIEFLTEWSGGYSNWKQTFYNGNIRKHYAGVGMSYNKKLDAFIPIKCHPEAVLNETTCDWDCSNAAHIVEA